MDKKKPLSTNKKLNPVTTGRNTVAFIVMTNNGILANDLYSIHRLNMGLAPGDHFHRPPTMYRMTGLQTAPKISQAMYNKKYELSVKLK